MRVLHFITSLKCGGAESALYNYLVCALPNGRDQHFVIYFYDGPNVERIKNLGVPVFQLSGRFLKYSPVTILKLKRLVDSIQPDVIHSSLWSANLIARLFRKFINIPLICDLHGSSSDEGAFRNFFDRWTVAIPDKIVAVSDSVKVSYLKNIVNSVKNKKQQARVEEKVVVIKNGIDFSALRVRAMAEGLSRSDFGLSDNDFVVGAVGRLEPIKSYDILIKAFAKFYKKNKSILAKLLIVGSGSQLQILRQLACDLGIHDHVIFTDFRIDAHAFYPLFNCFALSSKSEGLSIALLEALSFGLPVISTHDSLVHDVIVDSVNGFIIAPAEVDQYSDAIQKLYISPELREKITARNLDLVAKEFSIEKVVDQYKKIYSELVLNK